ncbi:MAG: hypothetical protein DHS20C08_21160 [Rhodomicrobium sp.]|nr:MAG: hypothetical protein DHS20C08_21160 [Rhodomicrobium sp.]
MTRFLLSVGNLIFAFFLGAVLLAFTFMQFPDIFETILNSAETARGEIISAVPASDDGKQIKNLVRFLIAETQLVFMFFVIVARIGLSLLIYAAQSVFSRVS